MTATSRGAMVIDLFGLSEAEVQRQWPAVYQYLADRVTPERDAKAPSSPYSAHCARQWWLQGNQRQDIDHFPITAWLA